MKNAKMNKKISLNVTPDMSNWMHSQDELRVKEIERRTQYLKARIVSSRHKQKPVYAHDPSSLPVQKSTTK